MGHDSSKLMTERYAIVGSLAPKVREHRKVNQRIGIKFTRYTSGLMELVNITPTLQGISTSKAICY